MDLSKQTIKELEDKIARGMNHEAQACFVEFLRREEQRIFEALHQSIEFPIVCRNQGYLTAIKWMLKQFTR